MKAVISKQFYQFRAVPDSYMADQWACLIIGSLVDNQYQSVVFHL